VHEAGEDHRRDPKRAQLPMDTELLTPQEAAVYLRLNPQTAYRLLQTGRLPGVKIGRQWRIRKATLDAYLDGQRQPSGTEDLDSAPFVEHRHP